MIAHLTVRYSGFKAVLVGQNNSSFTRQWDPTINYERNYFCRYMYAGTIIERRLDGALHAKYHGEAFLLGGEIPPYKTVEEFPEDTTWLCFSSWKPYTAEFLRLRETAVLPAGIGAFCVLGSFCGDGKSLKALNYLKPRDRDVQLTGDAKIVLIKPPSASQAAPLLP